MAELTEAQALKQARELKGEYNSHAQMTARRAVVARTREQTDILKAAGIPDELVNVLPWESEIPNQEARRYATALAQAQPEPKVFVQSEQSKKQETGELLERCYDAIITKLLPDDYRLMRHVSQDGVAMLRLDELDRWYDGRKREKGEKADAYLERLDTKAKGITLPFTVTIPDPADCYWLENREHTQLEFVAEYTKMRESEAKPDGKFETMGSLIVTRDRKTIRHFWSTGEEGGEQIFEGENRFRIGDDDDMGHTGYFLYRGLYTGLPDVERRYDPFCLVSLNIAQHIGFWMTLQSAYMVQAAQAWVEKDTGRVVDTTVQGRTAAVEKKAKGRDANTPRGGAIVAEFAQGEHVKFRELADDAGRMIDHLMAEHEMYRFRDTTLGEASGSDESGRSFIRRHEAAGQELAPGYREREQRTEELLRVIMSTLFHRPEYLGGSKNAKACIYIPHMVEGGGDDGKTKKEDLLELRQEHNIPHDLTVTVESKSDAAQLAWMEEGIKMEGHLPSDIIDEKFYGLRDIGLANRLRIRDAVRAKLTPAAIDKGIAMALADLENATIQDRPVIMPQDATQQMPEAQPMPMPQQPAATPMPIPTNTMGAISGQPTAPQPEDVGMALGTNGGTPLG